MASASKINKKMQISLDKLFGEIRQVTQALRKKMCLLSENISTPPPPEKGGNKQFCPI